MTLNNTLIELPTIIPDGEYCVQYLTYHTAYYRGIQKAPKVVVTFSVVDQKFKNTPLQRYYNVIRLDEPPGEKGDFSFGSKCDLYREYLNVFDSEANRKYIDWKLFEKYPVTAKVEKVTKDHEGRNIHRYAQYSIIKQLSKRDDLPF